MIIIMLGAQGTGKGTVAGLISEKTKWPQISTGDIFRKNISEKTELGIEADKYISQGNLVPDEITVPMVANRLKQEDAKDGAILDGFPRTIEQAEKLDEIFDAHIDVHTAASKLPSAHASILPPAIKISFILLPLVWTSFVISDI